MTTVGAIKKAIIDHDIKRARVIEWVGEYSLEFQVPKKHIEQVVVIMYLEMAVGIPFEVTPLPWWQCWFARYKFEKRRRI